MESPCNNCPEKQLYARIFDIHFSGADCPYECEEYERYLRSIFSDFANDKNKEVLPE